MSVSLTHAATTINATLRVGYEAVTSARNVFHDVPGRRDPDVTLIADGLRSGELQLFYELETDAWAAQQTLALTVGKWALHDDLAAVQMTFVRDGDMRIAQQDNRARWVLTVGFREVAP